MENERMRNGLMKWIYGYMDWGLKFFTKEKYKGKHTIIIYSHEQRTETEVGRNKLLELLETIRQTDQMKLSQFSVEFQKAG